MKSPSQNSFFTRSGALCALVFVGASVAQAQVSPITTSPIFSDDFSGGSLDASQWTVYDTNYSHGRAQFGNTPTTARDSDGTTYLKVPVQTYNPTPGQAGKTFLGTELFTRQNWELGAGKEYEARLRMKDLPAGLCLGYFAYGFSGQWQDTYLQSEIDYEFLTQQEGSKVWMNIWDDWNPLRGGPRGDGSGYTPLQAFSGLNWEDGGWHTFKIRWYPDHTDWIIDDRWVHSENRVRPGSPMGIRLNNWVPDSSWSPAYSSALSPTASAGANRVYSLDVDYVRVRPIPAPTRGVWGNGSGLDATYYDNADFTGTSVSRRDARLNFNWGTVGPASNIGADSWSVRWTGYIQPQYSESYTLTLRSDDGVRLYLNNTKVIDAWVARSATDSTYTFTATAGQKIPITIEYFDGTGGASCQFYWSSASTTKQLVPQSQLYPSDVTPTPTPTPTTAPTATPTPTPLFVAAPVFSPPGGTYSRTQQVAITSSTSGAIIYYTTNGSDPSQNSASLSAGQTVTVNKSLQLKARAIVPNQGASTISSATYTLSDTVSPTVAFTTPAANASDVKFGAITGTATDDANGSGISRVEVQILRQVDNMRWNGSAWISRDFGLSTTLSVGAGAVSTNWALSAALPTGANAWPGTYELKSIAYDGFGNSGAATQTFTILSTDVTPPTLVITAPRNNATIQNFSGIKGTLIDNTGGSGPSRVDIQIRRVSDNAVWNGWVWVSDDTAIPTVLKGNKWNVTKKAVNGATLPTPAMLKNQAFVIRAIGYDKAGNGAIATVTVKGPVQKVKTTGSVTVKSVNAS